MPLTPGTKLGPYEILSLLGAGGMGEVYLARDPRLGREVAIKVLPAERMADENRRRRFVQEARAASALNHPNIVTIHEIESSEGIDFIVMEYVPGKTLDALIPRQGMRLGEALRVAIPVADALAAAHASGMVHRDLKPTNVAIGTSGAVKVLDFGLAKLVASEIADDDGQTWSRSPGGLLTGAGSIVGTPAYMSPEQATGGRVDARSDIFSFGGLLYEMLTGRRPFAGGSAAETLAAIVKDEPLPPTALAPNLPRDLERIILRCLRKDPGRRFQHAADLKVELQELKEESDSGSMKPLRRRRLGPLVAAAGALVALAAGAFLARSRERPPAPQRLEPLTATSGVESTPSLSPDGEQVAFSWEGEVLAGSGAPNFDIWVKLVGASETRRLTSDPADDAFPVWSPDGRQIAFRRVQADRAALTLPINAAEPGISGTLHLVSPLGGQDRPLSDFPAAWSSQISWSPDGRFLAAARAPFQAPEEAAGIYLISTTDGAVKRLTSPKSPIFDLHPAFSADGKQLAYASCRRTIYWTNCDVEVVDLGEGYVPRSPPRRLTRKSQPILGIAFVRDGRSIVYGGGVLTYLWRVGVTGDALRRGSRSAASVPSNRRWRLKGTCWPSLGTSAMWRSTSSRWARERGQPLPRPSGTSIRTSRRMAEGSPFHRAGRATRKSAGWPTPTARIPSNSPETSRESGEARDAGLQMVGGWSSTPWGMTVTGTCGR